MKIYFRIPPLKKSFSLTLLQNSLSQSKMAIFMFILSQKRILLEMMKIFQKSNGNLVNFEKEFLDGILNKLKLRIEAEEESSDEDGEGNGPVDERQTPNDKECQKQEEEENYELNDKEVTFILGSMQFSIENVKLDEDKPLTELNVIGNSNISNFISLTFDVAQGFFSLECNNNERCDCEECESCEITPDGSSAEIPPFLKCSVHKIRTELYCTQCKRFICHYDLMQSDSPKCCANHYKNVITLVDHTKNLENEASDHVKHLEKVLDDIRAANEIFERESGSIMEMKNRNISTSVDVKNLLEHITSVLTPGEKKETEEKNEKNDSNSEELANRLEKLMEIGSKTDELLSKVRIEVLNNFKPSCKCNCTCGIPKDQLHEFKELQELHSREQLEFLQSTEKLNMEIESRDLTIQNIERDLQRIKEESNLTRKELFMRTQELKTKSDENKRLKIGIDSMKMELGEKQQEIINLKNELAKFRNLCSPHQHFRGNKANFVAQTNNLYPNFTNNNNYINFSDNMGNNNNALYPSLPTSPPPFQDTPYGNPQNYPNVHSTPLNSNSNTLKVVLLMNFVPIPYQEDIKASLKANFLMKTTNPMGLTIEILKTINFDDTTGIKPLSALGYTPNGYSCNLNNNNPCCGFGAFLNLVTKSPSSPGPCGSTDNNNTATNLLDAADCYLVCSNTSKFPAGLGDFLYNELSKGKGIVFCSDLLAVSTISGKLQDEIPFSFPSETHSWNDGPLSVNFSRTCLKQQQPQNNQIVSFIQSNLSNPNLQINFNGGVYSGRRTNFSFKDTSISSCIPGFGTNCNNNCSNNVIIEWNDAQKTPFLITKSYNNSGSASSSPSPSSGCPFGMWVGNQEQGIDKNSNRAGFGRIAFLNFYPVSNGYIEYGIPKGTLKPSNSKHYCGAYMGPCLSKCCNGFCGPNNGCNCSNCMKMDIKYFYIQQKGQAQSQFINREGVLSNRSPENGKFYCGRKNLVGVPNCDGFCGPTNGPNCNACRFLEREVNSGRYTPLIMSGDSVRADFWNPAQNPDGRILLQSAVYWAVQRVWK